MILIAVVVVLRFYSEIAQMHNVLLSYLRMKSHIKHSYPQANASLPTSQYMRLSKRVSKDSKTLLYIMLMVRRCHGMSSLNEAIVRLSFVMLTKIWQAASISNSYDELRHLLSGSKSLGLLNHSLPMRSSR